MIYGLYLSATGLMTNSYRQDVIANNLANSETIGFKRDLAMFQERPTAMRERNKGGDWSDPLLEKMGGGVIATPTLIDSHQGDLEQTGNPLDVGIEGNGFFAVANSKGEKKLTRDGAFMLNNKSELILSTAQNQHVLDDKGNPITLEPGGTISIGSDGVVTQNAHNVAKIGLYDVDDRSKFTKQGGTLLSYPDASKVHTGTGTMHAEYQERSNVDPTLELASLMETQRQLQANANMIQYQDQTLQLLVNNVGKIS